MEEGAKVSPKVKKLSRNMVLMRSRGDSIDQVTKLNLWGQGISDLSLVRQMPELSVVTLSLNAVEQLEPFSHCRKLEQLYLRNNKVSDLREICHLKELDNLTRLWLSDNPCTETTNYRHTVIKTLPQLTLLDNAEITEDEREEAGRLGEDLELEEEDGESAGPIPQRKEPEMIFNGPSGDSPSEPAELRDNSDKSEFPETPAEANIPKDDVVNSDPEHAAASVTETTADTAEPEDVPMSLEEANQLRAKLGLKPLPVSKPSPSVPRQQHASHDYNVRTGVLYLIKELDKDSLEVVMEAIKYRLKTDFPSEARLET